MKKIAPLMFMETRNEGEKLFRVTTTTMCPVCDAIWMFQYLSWAKEPKDIEGLMPGGIEGRELWTISTAKWGVHALCGECRARNLANYVKRIPGQSSKTLKLWTSELEAKLRGNLKHQQGKYKAWAKVDPFTEEMASKPLIDEQEDLLRRILPKGQINIYIEWREE